MIDHPGERPHERPPLDPDAFSHYLSRLKLTFRDAERLWGFDHGEIDRMASGKTPVPPVLEILIKTEIALICMMRMLDRHYADPTRTKPSGYHTHMEFAADALLLAIGRAYPPDPPAAAEDQHDPA